MPEDVCDVFGAALLDAQYSDDPVGARRFGEGLPREVMRIAADHQGDTFRLAYTTALGDAVFVLDAFNKKSKRGSSTPQYVLKRIRSRFKRAVRTAQGDQPK